MQIKGIVHFGINFWYVLASAVISILIFLGQTVLVCHSYNEVTTSKSMHREVQIKSTH